MLTEPDAPVALFLFAHQDDEFGVFAQIEQELQEGRRVCCIYATDGAATAISNVRDAESRAVLQRLGVLAGDIIFIGRQLGISDGQLHRHTDVLKQWLNSFFNLHRKLYVCFVPAWEGGHPDHDLLHAIAIELLNSKKNIVNIWQYSLYNGRNCFGPFFRLCSPLPENGPVKRSRISWPDRLRYVRLCLAYPSQWRTWIGLFPFACVHYFLVGVQQLQRVDQTRLSQPPHAQPLYYERRGFLDWSTMQLVVEGLISRQNLKMNTLNISSKKSN
jgi:LmbE family N-acetylglucosaminyl deacetylase